MLGGYAGKVLWVDLGKGASWCEPVSERDALTWIGGSGLAAVTVYRRVGPETGPLSPGNVLAFFTGPLTGTPVPSSGRHSVAGKSPLTGLWGEASVGGHWGRELKRAGYDGLVLTGASPEPVYLWISGDRVEIRGAASLWGLDTYDTEAAVRQLTHPRAQVCCIGPAGERLTPIAGLFTDGREGRAAGRCGLGAVAGAKKVKAVAVLGGQDPPLAGRELLQPVVREAAASVRARTKGLADFGTAGLVIPCERLGDFPVRNWSLGSWEDGAQKISGPRLAETVLAGRFHCAACPVGCGRRVAVDRGPYAGVRGGGPEYETLGLFGGSCLIDDLEAICYANELCNRYGIDTIEAGNLVAFSMEAFEKGIIGPEDTGGLILAWGDPLVLVSLVTQMGTGEGFGAVLAQGFPYLVRKYGEPAAALAMAVKGLGMPSHDPRAYNSLAVGYATANRGACHLEAFSHVFERALAMPELGVEAPLDPFAVEGKGVLTARAQNLMSAVDSLAVCKFLLLGGVGVGDLARWLTLATGTEFGPDDLLRCGERVFNLKRLFNVRCGVRRKDDTLPRRILEQKRGSGGAADNLPPLSPMLDEYYAFRGWSIDGVPSRSRLSELGLGEFVP